ncbi:MAG TPA: hypothetical protein PLN31_08275 [Azoarcus taiwanensis]|nr:hypothetical protein [Azoarcus taiwanensis]
MQRPLHLARLWHEYHIAPLERARGCGRAGMDQSRNPELFPVLIPRFEETQP